MTNATPNSPSHPDTYGYDTEPPRHEYEPEPCAPEFYPPPPSSCRNSVEDPYQRLALRPIARTLTQEEKKSLFGARLAIGWWSPFG